MKTAMATPAEVHFDRLVGLGISSLVSQASQGQCVTHSQARHLNALQELNL